MNTEAKPLIDLAGILIYLYLVLVIARLLIDRAPGLRMALGKEYFYLYRGTEPVLDRARRAFPPLSGVDLSPLGVLLGLLILKELVTLLRW